MKSYVFAELYELISVNDDSRGKFPLSIGLS